MDKNLNELQEEYEKEFAKFLMKNINHAGGSLQFQHLSNLLQQLPFEVKGALGITKSGLMKFLKTHSTTFKINSEGNVTIANPSPLGIGYKIKSEIADTKKISPPKIDNGTGWIFKIFPEFAIIKACTPFETYIFFTPVEYGAEENSLFTNLDLPMQTEVGFNAIHGHSDYEIEYRATKVWRNDSDSEEADARVKTTKTNKFTGEGIIKKLFSVNGIISVSGKEDMIVYFYRTNCKDIDIKIGDRVKFVAESISDKWQATEITKKKKEKVIEPPAHSQIRTGTVNKGNVPVSSNRIKDQPGKIYPYPKGAIIKFGENDSELADGNLCDYYLYSFKVKNSDLAMEFSEGDDIKFDAVKSKDSPGWKAVLAWVGDKPDIRDIDKKYFEMIDKNSGNPNEVPSAASSKVSAVSVETGKFNKNNYIINKESKLNSKPRGSPNERNLNGFSKHHQKRNIVDRKMVSQNLSHNDFKHNKNEHKYKQINKKPTDKYKQNPKSTEKKSKDENLNISKNTYLDTSEYDCFSEENNELQDNLHFRRKFLKEDKQCSVENSQSKYTDRNVKEEIYKNHKSKEIISTNKETSVKKRAKIKRYEDIDGQIIRLFSKCAFLKSDSLTKNIECVLTAFYKDGKGAEDEQIIDLKEVYRVGDSIKFNCFEIRDDFGDVHQKVTMAWKGPKPTAPETTPEAFISENDLQVTLNDESNSESESEKESYGISRSPSPDEICELDMENSSNESVDFVPKSKEFISRYNSRLTAGDEFDCESESGKESFDVSSSPSPSTVCESDTENSLNERLADDEYSLSKSQIDNTDQELLSSDVQHESLPNKIFKKLENYGFIFAKPEEGLNVVQEIIDLVLRNSNTEEDFNASKNKACAAESDCTTICSSCAQRNKEDVTIKNSATQTIVTGEIVLTSIFPQD